MKSIKLQENKWKDIELYLQSKKSIIVSFGSVEQHSTHLPLGTDSLVAEKVAEDVGKQTNTFVLPHNWFGWAPHHMAYPGTVTLRPETLTAYVEDILQSLIYHGFEKIIIINGHREANLPPIRIAMTRIRNITGAFIAIADPYYINEAAGEELRKTGPGGLGHAEELESSHMYYLYPNLCDHTEAKANYPEKHRFLQHDPYVKGDRLITASDVETYREVTKNIGIVGDATTASPDTGEKYHQAIVNNLVEFLDYSENEVTVTLRNQSIPL